MDQILSESRPIAFLRIDPEGLPLHCGGDCRHFGLDSLREAIRVDDQLDFLFGLLPLPDERLVLPLVRMANGSIAEVHLVRDDAAGDWILLIDAGAHAREHLRMQQYADDLNLLRKQQERLLARIEKNNQDLQTIFNQMRLITAIVEGDGRVSFISETGQQWLQRDAAQIIGLPWEEVLPFAEQDQDRIRNLFSLPAGQREKLHLHGQTEPGRHFWIELDLQDDPRDANRKIIHLYDWTEIHDLRRQLDEKVRFQGLIGKSKQMEQVFDLIQEVAAVDSTVLIEGETGSGKELVARAIHHSSLRKDKPFIAVNCAGLVDSLIDSQLFGHKKGAFTGAITDQMGVFEAADQGTLFLDEISDIPPNVQTRILRALEQREITRIGETKIRQVNVRILAATNKDLNLEVEKGNFRSDLLYRIRVARITIPPLRDRGSDIPLLADVFLKDAGASAGKEIDGFSSEAMRILCEHQWPGNVRELRNAIEYAVICCKGPVIQARNLPPEISESSVHHKVDGLLRDLDEKERIIVALQKTRDNRKAAAKLLGISRATLYRYLEKYGLSAK
ncbi:MAG: sigma 54-interacting transcriptional regulator [Myxococcales bacterium]|nr:sigma 54-interacting transcriptional regulator [Myxococcales bacterium]